MKAKVKIGLTGITFKEFWGFSANQYNTRKTEMKRLAAHLGASFSATPAPFQDAAGARAAARVLNTADLTILDVATFPEGKAAMTFFDTLKKPLVLWSRSETEYGTHIGHNSFCGANFLAGNLALRNTRFRTIYGSLKNPDVVNRLRTAVCLISAAKSSAGARIGLFGKGIVPKFCDIDIPAQDRAKLKSRYGIEFVNVPIKNLIARAESYPDKVITRAANTTAKHFDRIHVDNAAVLRQTRILRAVRDMTHNGNFASIAIRCWPELQNLYGLWPCPAISILNELGIPAACEGDPGGALDMLLASKLTGTPTTLLDIVDWNDRKNTFAVWHCGPTARSWATGKTTLMPHNVDGKDAKGSPATGLPGVVDMELAPGKVTVFRTLGALDDQFVLEGKIIRTPQRRICGSFGTVAQTTAYGRPITTQTIRETILSRALPHHYTVARGHLFSPFSGKKRR